MPGEYDSDRDRRVCELCDEILVGGPTSTSWEMHDHDVDVHGLHQGCGCSRCGDHRAVLAVSPSEAEAILRSDPFDEQEAAIRAAERKQ